MVTTVEELKKIKSTVEVELPPFADGTTITVKLRKVHFNELVKTGKIENPLLKTVMETQGGGKKDGDKNEDTDLIGFYKYMSTVAEMALVSPTYAEISKFAGGLSDEQVTFIHNLVIGEAAEWQKFC